MPKISRQLSVQEEIQGCTHTSSSNERLNKHGLFMGISNYSTINMDEVGWIST